MATYTPIPPTADKYSQSTNVLVTDGTLVKDANVSQTLSDILRELRMIREILAG